MDTKQAAITQGNHNEAYNELHLNGYLLNATFIPDR